MCGVCMVGVCVGVCGGCMCVVVGVCVVGVCFCVCVGCVWYVF